MALDLDPADRATLAAYALVLKNERKDFQGALAAYKNVLRLHPTDASTLCNIGVLYEVAYRLKFCSPSCFFFLVFYGVYTEFACQVWLADEDRVCTPKSSTKQPRQSQILH